MFITACSEIEFRASLGGFRIKEGTEISIVIPVYNENVKLKLALERTIAGLKEINCASEIIIAEDGSTDGTYEFASNFVSRNSNIRLLHSEQKQGRGRALDRAIKAANGDIICYLDVDLATDMSYLPLLVKAIRNEGYDLATGSRLMPQSDTRRSFKRSVASSTYNSMVRALLGSIIYDHQCGFKAFKRSSVLKLLDEVKDGHWFWDTELLVRAQHDGYRIKEIPVRWRESNSTKVDLKRDIIGMGIQILRLRGDLKKELDHPKTESETEYC
jgi:glycosyltransferase AglD